MVNYQKTPFPWFGGKSQAAPVVWQALGDVAHYVEPFAGSLAVLLLRPHEANRTYFSETVNDLDGLLVNAWRAITYSPELTAEHTSWPVSEVDLMARHLALVNGREELLSHMRASPEHHDPKFAGWWLWGQSSWIGSGWCNGTGPWCIGPNGGVVKQGRGKREPGVKSVLPFLTSDGRGVNRPQLRELGVGGPDFHPMTMPELTRWFQYLSTRLRHVRILQGDWKRAVTDGASLTLSVRQGKGMAGIFVDPPYSGDVRYKDTYSSDDHTIAKAVREWCLKEGEHPQKRIVLAGFDTEHTELEQHGWRVVEWFGKGFLAGGMGNTGEKGHQQKRERLWLSPHCLPVGDQNESSEEEPDPFSIFLDDDL